MAGGGPFVVAMELSPWLPADASILDGPQQVISMPNNLATIKQVQGSGPTKLKSIFLLRMACFGFDRGRAIRLLRSRIAFAPRTNPAVSAVRPICFRLDAEQLSGCG